MSRKSFNDHLLKCLSNVKQFYKGCINKGCINKELSLLWGVQFRARLPQ